MNAEQLAKQYEEIQKEKAVNQAYEKQKSINQAREKFQANVDTWLGEYLPEFTAADIIEDELTSGTRIKFVLPLFFRDIPGKVIQTFNVPSAEPADSIELFFGGLPFRSWTSNPVTTPIRLSEMAKLFHDLITYLPTFEKDRREREKKEYEDTLYFKGFSIDEVTYRLANRIQKFPNYEKEIQDAAQVRLDEIRRDEAESKLRDEQQQAIYAENQRLTEKAAAAWSTPFTVYLIEYGGRVADGEESSEPITREFYSMYENPDPSGYWHALKDGVSRRQIKPVNVLSIEKILITDDKNVPWHVRRYVTIKSKTVEGAEIRVSIPPVEAYAFDIEEE